MHVKTVALSKGQPEKLCCSTSLYDKTNNFTFFPDSKGPSDRILHKLTVATEPEKVKMGVAFHLGRHGRMNFKLWEMILYVHTITTNTGRSELAILGKIQTLYYQTMKT